MCRLEKSCPLVDHSFGLQILVLTWISCMDLTNIRAQSLVSTWIYFFTLLWISKFLVFSKRTPSYHNQKYGIDFNLTQNNSHIFKMKTVIRESKGGQKTQMMPTHSLRCHVVCKSKMTNALWKSFHMNTYTHIFLCICNLITIKVIVVMKQWQYEAVLDLSFTVG